MTMTHDFPTVYDDTILIVQDQREHIKSSDLKVQILSNLVIAFAVMYFLDTLFQIGMGLYVSTCATDCNLDLVSTFLYLSPILSGIGLLMLFIVIRVIHQCINTSPSMIFV